MASGRRFATPPVPGRKRSGADPSPHRADDRRLLRRLRRASRAHLGRVGLPARRAPLGAGAAVLPRPGGKSRRAGLAGRRLPRPLPLPRAAPAPPPTPPRPLPLPGAAPARGLRPADLRIGARGAVPRRERRVTVSAPALGTASRRARTLALRTRTLRVIGWALLAVLVVAPALWVLFLAPTTGKWATAF